MDSKTNSDDLVKQLDAAKARNVAMIEKIKRWKTMPPDEALAEMLLEPKCNNESE